jgi:hypothetical protein
LKDKLKPLEIVKQEEQLHSALITYPARRSGKIIDSDESLMGTFEDALVPTETRVFIELVSVIIFCSVDLY